MTLFEPIPKALLSQNPVLLPGGLPSLPTINILHFLKGIWKL
jgi:hypothetical protein